MALAVQTTDINLTPEQVTEVLGVVKTKSAVMTVGKQVALPGVGKVQHTIGKLKAKFVGEGERKPVSKPTVTSKTIEAYTVAVIFPVSKQLVRDAGNIYDALLQQGAPALAYELDRAVFGFEPKPGENFDNLVGAETVTVAGVADLVRAIGKAEAGTGTVSHIVALSNFVFELKALTDNNGRLLFDYASNTILGYPVVTIKAEPGDAPCAWIGDFNPGLIWGDVEGVEVSTSEHTSLTMEDGTQRSMYEHNEIAVRVEAAYGSRHSGIKNFVKIVAAPAATA